MSPGLLEAVIKKLREVHLKATILVRSGRGFARPDLYELCEDHGIHYLIRLKSNPRLYESAADLVSHFLERFHLDYGFHHVLYVDFHYQAKTWDQDRRVICKVERAAGELETCKVFIVTSLETYPLEAVRVYNKRGNLENLIKETRLDFRMETLGHSKFLANHARSIILAIAYNLINAMKRLVLLREAASSRMLSIRSNLIKVASKVTRHSRKIMIRFSSRFPKKNAFLKTLRRIENFVLE